MNTSKGKILSRSKFYGTVGLVMLVVAPIFFRTLAYGKCQTPDYSAAAVRVVASDMQALGLALALICLAARLPRALGRVPCALVAGMAVVGILDMALGGFFTPGSCGATWPRLGTAATSPCTSGPAPSARRSPPHWW